LGIGILGATVMPHNLYLHSELAKKRKTGHSIAQSLRFTSIDSFGALTLAAFVNIAILMLAAATFYVTGHHDVADIGQAYHMLSPILGGTMGALLFGIALLLAAQSSTITATMAGESIMQGFLQLKIAPWKRRLATRSLAIVPAVAIIVILGDTGLGKLLISSQVILSMQLPLAVIPLILFTSRKAIMKDARNHTGLTIVASIVGFTILAANCWLLWSLF
ncbi:MAG: Nramp family divalent metal transporter, partial [Candidatus Saccharibacteria bacterium]